MTDRSRRVAERQLPERAGLWSLLVTALFLARFWTPTEGSDQGQTLWIAAAWIFLAAARAWWLWREELAWTWRRSLPDLALGLAVLGILVSGGAQLLGDGDKRAAMNVMWEWISLVAMWLLLGEMFQRPLARRLFTFSLCATVVTLAGMGIWQHFVWYPQQSQAISELASLQTRIDTHQDLDPAARQRYGELVNEVGSEWLQLDTTGRRLLMSRTRDSVEPIGAFALANTFAGLLAVGLFLAFDLLRDSARRLRILHRVVPLLAVLIVAFCLLLTKSRTAWTGVIVAAIWWLLQSLRGIRREQHWRRWLFGAVVGGAILVTVASVTGGLDRLSVTEGWKSLSYRSEYWQATWRMLCDHPLLGAGPGNFRQYYLSYKLPGSSEEILDPHNEFLDMWSSGGALGLIGLLLLAGVWIGQLWRSGGDLNGETAGRISGRDVTVAGLVGGLLVLGHEFLFEGQWNPQRLVWVIGVAGVGAALARSAGHWTADRAAFLAGGTALWIHLLGAGGIGMPAISQLLLVLFLLSEPMTLSPERRCQGRSLAVAALISSILFVACLWSALAPVLMSAAMLQSGRGELSAGRPLAAEAMFRRAVEADPLSALSREYLALSQEARWRREGRRDDTELERACRTLESAIECDPRSPKRWHLLAIWWLQHFAQTGDPTSAESALRAAATATRHYPAYAPIREVHALALRAAGKDPQAEAQAALELDDLNRSRGHRDKLLSPASRRQLEEIVADGGAPAP